jgi:hypothetical protein
MPDMDMAVRELDSRTGSEFEVAFMSDMCDFAGYLT